MELLRCYYNFVRAHGALKFGREIRTPAMQAGLTTRRITFRDIFLATTIPLWSQIEVFLLSWARNPVSSAPVPLARSRVATFGGRSTLSVVIPCLKEAETLATCIEKASRSLRDNGIGGEVIIADNGSTDGSVEISAAISAPLVGGFNFQASRIEVPRDSLP